MSAYDQHLAGYRVSTAEVWCANESCPNHEGMTVAYFVENGIGWLEPEDCPLDGGDWLDEKPAAVVPFDPELSEAENRGSLDVAVMRANENDLAHVPAMEPTEWFPDPHAPQKGLQVNDDGTVEGFTLPFPPACENRGS